jgi:hypothetical protein
VRPPPRFLLAAGLLCAWSAAALADVFIYKDGRSVEGTLVEETATTVKVRTGAGEIVIQRSDLKEIQKRKTLSEEFAEREAAAKTAEDFFQLGEWAQKKKLKGSSTKAYQRAIELDPQHAGARKALGFVLYKGEWLTVAERDKRAHADEEAEMLARGFVRYGERWVTPDEKAKLEAGLVFYEGRWMEKAESMRLQGLEEFHGDWLPRHEALARQDVEAAERLALVPLTLVITPQAAIAGPLPKDELSAIGRRLDESRAWFDGAFHVEPGLALLGKRLAEFYCWGREEAQYVNTVDRFASLTPTVPPGWAEVVKKTHGFVWWDPYPVSSARLWQRSERDLAGHCLHHWGHILVNRLGYDGRLLPAWYDEGFAALTEYRSFSRNAVLCRGGLVAAGAGTVATKESKGAAVDPARFREGEWRMFLKAALEQKLVPPFDKLSQLEFGQLELTDIAAGMAIIEWVESNGPDSLRAFHDAVRRTSPQPPFRVIGQSAERQAASDAAFQAATHRTWRQADEAWRTWFLSR